MKLLNSQVNTRIVQLSFSFRYEIKNELKQSKGNGLAFSVQTTLCNVGRCNITSIGVALRDIAYLAVKWSSTIASGILKITTNSAAL